MPGLHEITPKSLARLVGTPDAPFIVDVRIPEDLVTIPFSVPLAEHISHSDISDLLDRARGQQTVVICHKGKKLSHGAAALLRHHGISAEVLEGGMVAWQELNLPSLSVQVLHELPSRWVTRHRPKIDRIACPWLIRRFINPDAEFLFVPPGEVMDVAERFDAVPFDMPEGKWTHKGAMCTFDAMLEGFGLKCKALERLAKVVRAADTNQLANAPQASGLLAISAGYSRLIKDDTEQLNVMMPLYDALYRWARDAHDETHDWPNPAGK